ncbi:methyltransferase domain-containing protein [Tropicibacter oceani]|uniref:Methyltransferase domain-containing protein n=1 Tax=Tropicibacter oceani TaxID=3058420 RepID=A0ABY8QKA6_9RHOB|nr:methyltransferase domain-containing protein [Tropicibacter oceani]WGW05047.1 methyltransferase domain-containing protein [Tropicibacter oceani]
MTQTDWNPGVYARYADLRLRPALDLLARVPDLPDGVGYDLGCGSGVVGPMLRGRLGARRLVGVENSPAMLEQARAAGAYDDMIAADLATWNPKAPAALLYSNAALHWVKDHRAFLPRLVGQLLPGGTLAVQVPHQNNAPSHRLWLNLADEMFPGRVDHAALPAVLLPAEYHHLLSPLGRFDLWETEYYQLLQPTDEGHPVRLFSEATYARPILQALEPGEQAQLIAAYESVIAKAYPFSADGSVLFPFRRMFFTLTRTAG